MFKRKRKITLETVLDILAMHDERLMRYVKEAVKEVASFHPGFYSGVKVRPLSKTEAKKIIPFFADNTNNNADLIHEIIQYRGKNVFLLIEDTTDKSHPI